MTAECAEHRANDQAERPETYRKWLLGRLWEQTLRSAVNDPLAIRSRLLLLLSGLSLVINLLYAAASASIRDTQALSVSLMTVLLVGAVFVSAWRWGWRRSIAWMYLFSAILNLTLYILIANDVHSAITAWIPFIPMLAMLLLDRRDGVAITVLATLTLSLAALYVNTSPAHDGFIDALTDSLPTLFAFTLTSFATLSVILVYIHLRDMIAVQQDRERQAKETLLRILSHDVANNLSIIRMSTLSLAAHPDRLPGGLDNIRTATEHIIEMVHTVRSMAALEEGRLNIRLAPVNVHDAISAVLDTVRPRAEQKGVRLRHTVSDEPVWVYADRTYLEQTVLANLITNAVKFTPSGRKVSVYVTAEEKQVAIHIQDEGIGIPSALREHLFDPGKENSRDGTAGETGTGFGLPLVKQFVDYFNGDIAVRSNDESPDTGTTFTVCLPRAPAPQEEQKAGTD